MRMTDLAKRGDLVDRRNSAGTPTKRNAQPHLLLSKCHIGIKGMPGFVLFCSLGFKNK